MARHLLTDKQIRQAKPKDDGKGFRLYDGDGLALWVSPTGVKSWQFRYRLDGKEQTATLGKYSAKAQGLAWARARCEQLRPRADRGEHLTVAKRKERLERAVDTARTFAKVAADWMAVERREAGWSDDYAEEVRASLRNHLSELDPLPVNEITAPIAARLIADVEAKAPDMARKVRRRLHAVLDFAVERAWITGNPLPVPRRRKRERKHYPAVTKLPAVGEILRAARASDPAKGVQRAHLLLAFTAQRASEVVGAKWEEVDFAAGVWSIPRARMKRKDEARGPHEIPLPPALLAMMREWRAADGDGAVYVCPAPRDVGKEKRPITREAVEKHYREVLGLRDTHSPHSWRSTFSTICREAGKDADAVESQLDHVVGNAVAAAYDKAKRLQLRRDLLRWYERQLIAARDGAEVVPMKKART
ncbi:MAG: tyrosine-type recombinase/integrase [Burkholderiales bacterium]